MGERWLTIVLEREPERPVRPRPPDVAPPMERRPVSIAIPAVSPRRRTVWSLAAGALVVSGVLAAVLGAWLVAASGARWNEIASDAAEVGEDLANRSQAAAAGLTDDLAELESISSMLSEVSVSLDAAVSVAVELEAVASGGFVSGPGGVERLVGEIDRLAGAIDAAFPGLAELGITGADGPGNALRAAGAALMAVSDDVVPVPVTGFGPFVLRYPLPGYSVTDPFGTPRGDRFHQGIDIGAPAGTPILAADDGVVVQSGWLGDGAGNGVILRHEHDWETRYFHMVSADLPVTEGETVLGGQVIGNVGSTGESTGPHLHFEIVFGPIRMDPDSFSYIGREIVSGGPPIDPPTDGSKVTGPGPVDLGGERPGASASEGSMPDIAAPSDASTGIAEVQRELLEIGADASDQAAVLEERRLEEQGRGQTAALVLYGGAVALVLGLLMWGTRWRWPFSR